MSPRLRSTALRQIEELGEKLDSVKDGSREGATARGLALALVEEARTI